MDEDTLDSALAFVGKDRAWWDAFDPVKLEWEKRIKEAVQSYMRDLKARANGQ